MKNRSRVDIAARILDSAQGSTAKTRIMYGAALTHSQLNEYISVMVERDLLEYDSETHTCRTTRKGLKFLEMYEEVGRVLAVST
jgi:predicted transcriptional regulator